MVLDKVKKIIAEGLGLEVDDIKDTSNIIDDLGADSLDMVELVMAIEDEFSIEIQDDVVENIKTIGDIVKYIEELEQ